MKFFRELESGDSIKLGSNKITIGRILSQDFYISDWDDSRSYVDIEFEDNSGNYHSWKSNLDGGSVIYKSCLSKFRDKGTGRFFIPFTEMQGRVTDEVLYRLHNGWGLSAYEDPGYVEKTYTLFEFKDESPEYGELKNSELIKRLTEEQRRFGVPEFTSIRVDSYFENEKIQNFIDTVLLKGLNIDDYYLALSGDGKDKLVFLQAKELFY